MAEAAGTITLKPGREKTVLKRHPWIFSGAIGSVTGKVVPGDTVAVLNSKREFLAWADFNPNSQIAARIWSWDERQKVDETLIEERITTAIEARSRLRTRFLGMESDAMRLIFAESDGLPGLVVDQYADQLVLQFLTAGIDRWREPVVEILSATTGLSQIYERSDVDVRELEGLLPRTGVLRGDSPTGLIPIEENGLRFRINIRQGHKTGFYLDQKVNRWILRYLTSGLDILDCFCYSGGFTCAAIMGGARSVWAVDSSPEALDLVRLHLQDNQFAEKDVHLEQADVFQALRQFRDRGYSFDVIILDPPKFAHSQAQVEKAARGYKDINLLAFKLLRPGGYLMSFSCSGNVDEVLFQKIIAGAALDAQVEAQIIQRLHQSPDHPVALNFPESAYLKGFLIQVAR